MDVASLSRLNNLTSAHESAASQRARSELRVHEAADESEVRAKFQQFVGETFYGQMLKQMRKTVPESEYFGGGSHAEKVFRAQLDQTIAQKMAETSAEQLSEPMYRLFSLQRS